MTRGIRRKMIRGGASLLKSTLSLMAIAGMLMLGSARSAMASGVVFDASPPNDADGHEMTQYAEADDFSFPNATTVTGMQFWSLEGFGTGYGGNQWEGVVQYFFFTDAGGAPAAAPFASGNGALVSRTFLQNEPTFGLNEFDYVINFAAPMTFSAGTTYWVGLHLATDYTDRDQIYWETTSSTFGNAGHSSELGTFDNWFNEGEQFAFQLLSPCGSSPMSCRAAGKSALLLKNSADDTKDKLTWKWLKGAATTLTELGVPTGTTNYALCVYAGTAVATIDLPAGSKWQATGTKGFKFKDPTGTPDGAQKASLKSGAAGKAKTLVKGKGINLPDNLVGPLPLPVTAQLVNETTNVCFGSVYTAPDIIKNDGTNFKAKH
jgi:hypothetical protein